MQAFLLSFVLSLSAPAAADTPPAIYFAVDRAQEPGAAILVAAALRQGLFTEPENLWLHDAWQRLHARGALSDGRLEVEYRAFHAKSPSSPGRQLLLALALIRAHEQHREDRDWIDEATTLIEGSKRAAGLAPWAALAANQLARAQSDRATARKTIEDAWTATGGHLALVPARASLVGRDEIVLANFALEIAAREPRLVPRMIAGHTPPLEAGAVEPMRKVHTMLADLLRKTPSDAALAWSVRSAAALLGDGPAVADAERVLQAADPGWKPAADAIAAGPEPDAPAFAGKLQAAISSPPGAAAAVFERLEAEALQHPSLLATFYMQWGAVRSRGPERDPAQAVVIYRKALSVPGIGQSLASARNQFAFHAAASGLYLEEAARSAEVAVAAAWDGVRAMRAVSGARDDRKDWANKLAHALEARGAVKVRQGDAHAARRDLVLATFINPERDGRPFARLAEVEETLGHPADALDAWIAAVARGHYEPERVAEWQRRLTAAGKDHLQWATVEQAVAAEVARLDKSAAADEAAEPAHPLVGQPAPDFEVDRLGGGKLTLASFKGRPVVVDYWATWCGPCKMEMPALQRLHDKYAAKGVSFVLLSTDDDSAWKELVPGFVKGMGLTMTVGRATEAVQSAYKVGGIPSLFLVGRDGKVVNHHLGYTAGDEDKLAKEIEAQLR